MSNPYHVVLNRKSSGERGALWDQTGHVTGTIKSEAISNDTESHGDGETMEMTATQRQRGGNVEATE